jgi:hypoxanthine phosphoribosyltransferase
MKNIYLDYNQISLGLDTISEEVIQENFSAIVIILRGGCFPGIHLGFLTGLPCYFLKYNRKEENASWLGDIPNSRKILLVEDFAGMGRTLINCKNFLLQQGFDTQTLVVCKDTKSASIPNFYCFETTDPTSRFILPWERYRLNSKQIPSLQTKADHEYERTLWDWTLASYAKKKDGVAFANINKGELAVTSGFTHLVLENVEEAIQVSSQYPELRVAWWNDEKTYYIQSREKP